MTRILVQRGSGSSSSNRASGSSSNSAPNSVSTVSSPSSHVTREDDSDKDTNDIITSFDGLVHESSIFGDEKLQSNEGEANQEPSIETGIEEWSEARPKSSQSIVANQEKEEIEELGDSEVTGSSYPPPPPVPPPKPSANSSNRRIVSGGSAVVRSGPSRRSGWPVVSSRTSSSGSLPSSPRSFGEGEGYNSADEQGPCFGSSYADIERERQFELDIRRTKGLEVKRMVEDGNCLFRAIADQVFGDPEMYDETRHMCIDYMEKERDHFSQFITEGFTSYCKRKRRDKVYGNNVEIQAFCEMFNRPIHIFSYGTEPINIFHNSYHTDTPPIRLSYHHGNHYNSLVDPRRLTIGAGLGYSSLRGTNIDKDQVKAAIKAQQDQQLENALLAEGRFYSDLELTEKEIERMVMEASRAEYLAEDKFKQQLSLRESSTSSHAEPSSSGAITGPSEREQKSGLERTSSDAELSSSMQMVLSMGFSYRKVIEAYSIFGNDVESMVCYLLEMGSASPSEGTLNRLKGKATE
ncbi:OTU domain-containing protein 5-B isoform X2 [Amborella trichopoda]|uniref:OTU domain-containing protein 5-B isoform X2 n=1 Tax=Amborella trichopoda TaxID=13333 RepID=UPI0009BD82FC|nr:OTU domain-containing protein 5-B isoform X2 [Amborella trichopoda]|eukprot:XP_020527335.1 OTU domain-containing protein 5-B isoform X2 [Amborella trichopoda]